VAFWYGERVAGEEAGRRVTIPGAESIVVSIITFFYSLSYFRRERRCARHEQKARLRRATTPACAQEEGLLPRHDIPRFALVETNDLIATVSSLAASPKYQATTATYFKTTLKRRIFG